MTSTDPTPAKAASAPNRQRRAKIIVWVVLAALVLAGVVAFFAARAPSTPEAAPAQAGQAAFARALPIARAATERAGARDSISWIEAQEAVSGLDAARVETVVAMAELDALGARGVGPDGLRYGDNDFAAIRTAGERVFALVDAQDAEIGRLSARLGG